MANFDFGAALNSVNSGTFIGEAVASQYGVPSCMMNLGKDLLSLLPSPVLGNILNLTDGGLALAEASVKKFMKNVLSISGMIDQALTEGVFTFLSDSSLFGIDAGKVQALNDLAAIGGMFNSVLETGAALYDNYLTAVDQIHAIKECFDKLDAVKQLENNSGTSFQVKTTGGGGPGLLPDWTGEGSVFDADGNLVSDGGIDNGDGTFSMTKLEWERYLTATFGSSRVRAAAALDFINEASELKKNIEEVLLARKLNPDLEPCIIENEFTPGTSFRVCAKPSTEPSIEELKSPFRLVFGPPKTSSGQFLLTVDGLYYDSQGGGLDPVNTYIQALPEPEEGDKWKFEQDPYLGGKGQQISLKHMVDYVDTLFDPDIIDESKQSRLYYEHDHLIQFIEGQKDKKVYDLSGQVIELLDKGESQESAVVQNLTQSIYSVIAQHDDKIRRRKKQIEVAIKTPTFLDSSDEEIALFQPGEVPINDFSYLSKFNLAIEIEKQKNLVFNQAEVEGVVLPLEPIFVEAPISSPETVMNHLRVPVVGRGDIIFASSSVDLPEPYVLSLTDEIVVEDLIASYNFLEADVGDPSSTDFSVLNCAVDSEYNNAQLVADHPQPVFTKGLAIPYLEGIVEHDPVGTVSVGSYVKLPDTPEFRDLAYNPKGFTVESWIHMPELNSWTDAPSVEALHKILLSCENTGGEDEGLDPNRLTPTFGSDYARGLVMGFTRDNQITSQTDPDDGFPSPGPSTPIHFYVAPTQSTGADNVAFINNSSECASGEGWYSSHVDITTLAANGKSSLSDVSSTFVLLSVAVDPPNDKIKFYIDGSLLSTSSLSKSMGRNKYSPISVPSFAKLNSFEYGSSAFQSFTTAPKLDGGPKMNVGNGYSFTPWIVGGGYTDGIKTLGGTLKGFMGGESGQQSGLKGHVGGLKFYSKPLTNTEVLQNFKAQQGFFKNIEI